MLLFKFSRLRLHINNRSSDMQYCFSLSVLIWKTKYWHRWKALRKIIKGRKTNCKNTGNELED